MTVTVRAPQTPDEWTAYFALRYAVLRQPWGQPPGSERADDDDQPTTCHAAAFAPNGTLVGVGRLHMTSDNQGQLRYMAVAAETRGAGVGSAILQHLEVAGPVNKYC